MRLKNDIISANSRYILPFLLLCSQNISNIPQLQSHLVSKIEAYPSRCNKTLAFCREADYGGDYATWKL